MESKKRGSYKKYLKNSGASIPKTSWWRINKSSRKRKLSKSPSTSLRNNVQEPDMQLSSRENVSLMQLSNPWSSSNLEKAESEEELENLQQEDSDSASDSDSVRMESDSSDIDDEQERTKESFEDVLEESMFEPLYDNAKITVSGAFCAIMEFKRACRLPFTTIAKLLDLLQLVCPANNHLPTSVHKLKKYFSNFSSAYNTQYFCHICHTEYLPNQKVCSKCTISKTDTLIVTDPKQAITRVLKRNLKDLIWSPALRDNEVLRDVHMGKGWKDTSLQGIIFNTDGISPFKSSTVTVWPLLIALTILPPTIRMNKDNIITLAIWSGESKPPMHVLLKPLFSLLESLQNEHIVLETSCGTKALHFFPAFGLFDLVAKAQVLNMNQFNGANGCPTCLNPGIRTVSQYYPPDNSCGLRTNESVIKDAEDACKNKTVVYGIKGKSPLTGFVDLVNSIPVDYMHCVLEGVTKWLVDKWLSSCNHAAPFYIGTQVKLIDKDLVHQRPPHDFTRAPRSLEKHRRHFKASEFRNWLLYYSLPLLETRLAPLYLHHYSLLVSAMHILLRSELTEIQIQAAETMLTDFYSMLPELYGINSCTLNAHCLTHLTYYVRLWGPLWTQSLFGFENMNGHLVSMLHSKRKLAEQLIFSIDVSHTIGMLSDQLAKLENQSTIEFLKPMSSLTPRRSNMTLISTGVYSIGSLNRLSLSEEEQHAISAVTNEPPEKVIIFTKLYYHDTIIQAFSVKGQRDSSTCCFIVNGGKEYGKIQKFVLTPPLALLKPHKKTASSLLQSAGYSSREKLQSYARADLLSSFIIQVDKELKPTCAVPISCIVNKCILVSCQNSCYSYIINIPNNYEHH